MMFYTFFSFSALQSNRVLIVEMWTGNNKIRFNLENCGLIHQMKNEFKKYIQEEK